MKIIKQGIPKKEVWRGKCNHCNSEMQAEKHEVEISSGYDPRDNYSWSYGTAICPVCKKSFTLYSKLEEVRPDPPPPARPHF